MSSSLHPPGVDPSASAKRHHDDPIAELESLKRKKKRLKELVRNREQEAQQSLEEANETLRTELKTAKRTKKELKEVVDKLKQEARQSLVSAEVTRHSLTAAARAALQPLPHFSRYCLTRTTILEEDDPTRVLLASEFENGVRRHRPWLGVWISNVLCHRVISVACDVIGEVRRTAKHPSST